MQPRNQAMHPQNQAMHQQNQVHLPWTELREQPEQQGYLPDPLPLPSGQEQHTQVMHAPYMQHQPIGYEYLQDGQLHHTYHTNLTNEHVLHHPGQPQQFGNLPYGYSHANQPGFGPPQDMGDGHPPETPHQYQYHEQPQNVGYENAPETQHQYQYHEHPQNMGYGHPPETQHQYQYHEHPQNVGYENAPETQHQYQYHEH
ncbi:hypothetical protein JCM3770_007151, partial [Rhodotorula araucariae]